MRIASIILNFNSENDLRVCVNQIISQKGVHLVTIIVDNASRPESMEKVCSFLKQRQPKLVAGSMDQIMSWVECNNLRAQESGNIYFVKNSKNLGYSAGNNIGIRLAEKLKMDAVLIVNPDVRIEDENYLRELARNLFANEKSCVAASRIIGLDGRDQNPLREISFWEELFWVVGAVRKPSFIFACPVDRASVVPKVSGCCLMLKMSFLKKIYYLDENVFLYCEEPILSAKVKSEQGNILYVPQLAAQHAHKASEKGRTSIRMRQFIKSRRYYLHTYSDYNSIQKCLLNMSYAVLGFICFLLGGLGR